MLERRRYERYAIIHAEDKNTKIEMTVEGESVHLVDFSLGGLYFFRKNNFLWVNW